MVCGSGALASSPPPPPIRAVRASSQASRAAGHLRRDATGGCAAGGGVEAQEWGRAALCVQAAGERNRRNPHNRQIKTSHVIA